jgi:hypothetical protein
MSPTIDLDQEYRLVVRTVLVVAVVAALLVFSSSSSAGPPVGICRHISKQKCEQVLGPYAAAQHLQAYVMHKLRPRLTSPFGSTLYCNYPKRHRPWVFRCGDTIERGGLPSPCIVEALVKRDKPRVFSFDWLKESASCN